MRGVPQPVIVIPLWVAILVGLILAPLWLAGIAVGLALSVIALLIAGLTHLFDHRGRQRNEDEWLTEHGRRAEWPDE